MQLSVQYGSSISDSVVPKSLSSKGAWQHASVNWWLAPKRWGVYLAQSGPASWPRTARATAVTTSRLPAIQVTAMRQTVSQVSFRVNRIGVPVVVRVSYYPRWHASGAEGPWRVSPNLMVVVPTSRTVVLTYGSSSATTVGVVVTVLAAIVACVVAVVSRRRRLVTGARAS